jgi:hypothetical protein
MAPPRYGAGFAATAAGPKASRSRCSTRGFTGSTDTGERGKVVDERQEAAIQCVDCMHDQPHLVKNAIDKVGFLFEPYASVFVLMAVRGSVVLAIAVSA